MTRAAVFKLVDSERENQRKRWGGSHHDVQHDANDWVALIARHSGRAAFAGHHEFRGQMIVVAALAVAALELCNAPEFDAEE